MVRGLLNGLFGLLFNLATVTLVVGIILLIGALKGGADMVWLARTGLILEVLGISIFALEYVGITRHGYSPIRWWLRKLIGQDERDSPVNLWPRQLVVTIGLAVVVAGLLLQFLSSWT